MAAKAVWYESPPTNLTGFVMDYNFYNAGVNDTKFSYVIRNPDASHNYQFSQWKTALGLDKHGLLGNPLFVDAAGGDFHLQPNSPACISGETGSYIGAFPCK